VVCSLGDIPSDREEGGPFNGGGRVPLQQTVITRPGPVAIGEVDGEIPCDLPGDLIPGRFHIIRVDQGLDGSIQQFGDREAQGPRPTAIYAPVVTPVEPALPVVKVVTVGQVWGEYYRIYVDPPQVIGAVRQGKAESYARMQLYYWTKYIAPQLADVPLAAMDTAAIERFLDGVTGLKGRPIPTTVNRIQSLLSKMFTWAKRRYPKEIPSHPVLGREKNVEETRKRRLTEDEVKLWAKGWLHSDNPDKYALLFSLLTGCRVGVVMGFQPSWITPTHLAIPERVQGVKNCRFVIVQSVAQPLMAKIPSGLTYSRLSGCFINICENSGIFLKIMVDDKPQTISPHSLRKTFRSIAGDIGESDDLVEALISHKNGRGKVTEAYLIRSLPPLVPVAERISQYIINLLGIDPASL